MLKKKGLLAPVGHRNSLNIRHHSEDDHAFAADIIALKLMVTAIE